MDSKEPGCQQNVAAENYFTKTGRFDGRLETTFFRTIAIPVVRTSPDVLAALARCRNSTGSVCKPF